MPDSHLTLRLNGNAVERNKWVIGSDANKSSGLTAPVHMKIRLDASADSRSFLHSNLRHDAPTADTMPTGLVTLHNNSFPGKTCGAPSKRIMTSLNFDRWRR